jgi:hypothetical protein
MYIFDIRLLKKYFVERIESIEVLNASNSNETSWMN